MPVWFIKIAPYLAHGINEWRKARAEAKAGAKAIRDEIEAGAYDDEVVRLMREANAYREDAADHGLIDLSEVS